MNRPAGETIAIFIMLAAIVGVLFAAVDRKKRTPIVEKPTTSATSTAPSVEPLANDPDFVYAGTKEVIVTAYSPRETCPQGLLSQCVTASGETIREGIAAMNCVPFGTEVYYEGNQYEIWDRLPANKGCDHLDIFYYEWDDAIRFGVKAAFVSVYEPVEVE